MQTQSREVLRMGIPYDLSFRSGAVQLLKIAGVPLVGRVDRRETVLFDANTNALKKPNPGQAVYSLDVSEQRPASVTRLMNRAALDLAVVPAGVLRRPTFPLALPGEERGSILFAELVIAQTIDEELLDAEKLRGIEGFRDRLIAKVFKASRKVALAAQSYQEECAKRPKYEGPYRDWRAW